MRCSLRQLALQRCAPTRHRSAVALTTVTLALCLAAGPGMAAVVKDQGRIYATAGAVEVTGDTLSQSVTAGISGQLAAIQLELIAPLPVPAPRLDLAIRAGGNPPAGKLLYSEQVNPGQLTSDQVLTWDIRKANIGLENGRRFVITLSASAPGITIAGNDPPGYLRGELYLNGKALPPSAANDIAFISYVAQAPLNPDEPIPAPGGFPVFEPGDDGPEPPDEEPEPSGDESGLVIAANDPPGYDGGQLFRNGKPQPENQMNDLAFITYVVADEAGQAAAESQAEPAPLQDQGQIFSTGGTVSITADTLAQSVTAGVSGQLVAITMQWNAEIPDPPPLLNLALLAGGTPSTWKTLYGQQRNAAQGLPVDSEGVFTWDLAGANLHFAKGDQFTFTLSAESGLKEVQVVSTRDVGAIESNPQILTRDCGYSAWFRGRSVWFFGDTVLRTPNADNQQLLCNSWSLSYDRDGADGMSGLLTPADGVGASMALVPLTGEETAFNQLHQGKECPVAPCETRWALWPGTIAVDKEADIAYLFYHKVMVGAGDYNFDNVGHSVAIMDNPEAPAYRPEFRLYKDYPTLLFSEERDGFGSAAVQVGQFLYIYGCEMQADDVAKPCRLARVRIDRVLERRAWKFYRGQGQWSTDLAEASTVFRGNDMMSVFYNEYLGRYVAVYSQPLGTRVMIRTAERPEGPWSRASMLFQCSDSQSFMGWIYDALAHPELSDDKGRTLYVTYSRHTGLFRTEFRLVAVEVALTGDIPDE